jgi:DNA adenine methylase
MAKGEVAPAPQNPPRAKPFLRWIGGKQQIVARLLSCLPEDIGSRRYVEPFVGAGSLFFALAPQSAALSDLNEHLVHCYESIRDEPELVAVYLGRHRAQSCRGYYDRQRETYNKMSKLSVAQAARFIYLNQACFNGVFRVNKKGEYNVPFGQKDHLALPSAKQLKRVADLLKTAKVCCASYNDILKGVGESDFVYLDPPYPPLNGTAYFTHYTKDRFGADDQTELAQLVADASGRGCKVMMTNADTPVIRELYAGFRMKPVSVTRFVTCKKKRHKVSELVITNYELAETDNVEAPSA